MFGCEVCGGGWVEGMRQPIRRRPDRPNDDQWFTAGRNHNCSALCVDNECYVMLELEQADKREVVIGQGLGRTTKKVAFAVFFCVVRSFYFCKKKEQFALLKIVWISLCALCQMVLNGAK